MAAVDSDFHGYVCHIVHVACPNVALYHVTCFLFSIPITVHEICVKGYKQPEYDQRPSIAYAQ